MKTMLENLNTKNLELEAQLQTIMDKKDQELFDYKKQM